MRWCDMDGPGSMTDCARCGDCCDPIILPATKKQVREQGSESAPFILQHWRRINRQEAISRRPDMPADVPAGYRFYECDAFDPENRLCTARDSRPPVCRGFPWYGDEPNPGKLISLTRCSFWADIPPARRPEGMQLLPIVT